MADQQTGKQRAARIPLDYFKKPDRVQRLKLWLTALAVLAALGWWAGNLVRGDRGRLLYSRGPVASVHATWNAECAACHASFQPIGSNVGMSKWLGHASDQKCETCHAGPPHSERQIAAEVQACADCHRDHRGADASLVRLPDSDCTRCHADLARHVNDARARYANVSRFDLKEHPDFKAVRDQAKDPGHLKFSHQVHLSPGMAGPGQAPNPDRQVQIPFTLAQISEAERERYRRNGQAAANDAQNKVQLDCASCHVLDSGDFKGAAAQLTGLPADALLPPRSAGASMLPITYENQCKACHPLTVEKSAGKNPALAVPHRLQPDAVYQFLNNAYVGRYIANNPSLLETMFVPPRTIPGKPPAEPAKPSPEQEKARSFIAQEVVTAEKILYLNKQTCGECHNYETIGNAMPVFPKAQDFKLGQPPDFRIQPTAVPDIWFKQARFDHSAHKALDCRACHGAADTSRDASDVLIPGIANCLQCHAPQRHEGGKPVGGARFDCTECHSYHHGDAPLQGPGAAARAPRDRLSIQQFLNGGGAADKPPRP